LPYSPKCLEEEEFSEEDEFAEIEMRTRDTALNSLPGAVSGVRSWLLLWVSAPVGRATKVEDVALGGDEALGVAEALEVAETLEVAEALGVAEALEVAETLEVAEALGVAEALEWRYLSSVVATERLCSTVVVRRVCSSRRIEDPVVRCIRGNEVVDEECALVVGSVILSTAVMVVGERVILAA
jgi:hypothetical protein